MAVRVVPALVKPGVVELAARLAGRAGDQPKELARWHGWTACPVELPFGACSRGVFPQRSGRPTRESFSLGFTSAFVLVVALGLRSAQ